MVTLPLQPFSLEETQQFVEAALDLGDDGAAGDRIGRVIWDMTGGWPLYAEQVWFLLSDWQKGRILSLWKSSCSLSSWENPPGNPACWNLQALNAALFLPALEHHDMNTAALSSNNCHRFK